MRDLRGIRFSGVDFSGWDLRRVDLSRADLRGTSLANARLDSTTLLNGAVVDKADLDAVRAAAGRLPKSETLRAGTIICDAPWAPQMIFVPPGRFEMGMRDDEGRREKDDPRDMWRQVSSPLVEIAISPGFWLGRYPVTVGEFRAFVEATGYRVPRDWSDVYFQVTDREGHPVVQVSWSDALAYVKWLSAETGRGYRLPTEAEWEYACRAGITASRYWGDNWGKGHRYAHVDAKGTRHVGELLPNAWSLHDMLGNVWEWTQDVWTKDLRNQPTKGSAKRSTRSSNRVLRGGSWINDAGAARAGIRVRFDVDLRDDNVGFRVARTF